MVSDCHYAPNAIVLRLENEIVFFFTFFLFSSYSLEVAVVFSNSSTCFDLGVNYGLRVNTEILKWTSMRFIKKF